MQILKNKILFILLFGIGFLFPFNSFSQKLAAQVSKNRVAVGEAFQITFSANGNISNFKAPPLSDFDVYSGPNQSTSMQIINGNMSQSMSLSYMIAARKEGKFTIGSASATINNGKSESNPITIEVVKGNPQQQGQAQNQNSNSGGVSNEDLFVRSYLSKKQCYVGEQIVLTQKVYSRANLRGFQNVKAPAYNGFWSKEEVRQGQIQLNVENLDGVNYNVAEFSKTYLFAQRTGKLTIEPIEIDCIVRQQVKQQSQNIFDQFFGGGYQDVAAKIKSKPVTVDVQALPEANKPPGFTGAVGKFNFKAELNHAKVKANESVNLKITISGSGNISLVDAPKITFPEDVETYDPKTNETVSTNGGVNGTKTYEYLIIPRKQGVYNLKDVSFSYFDIDKKQYISIPSPDLVITADAPDPNSVTSAQVYNPKNKVEEQENDIRYIKTGDLKLKPVDDEFFASWKHYSLLALILLLFVGFIIARSNYLKSQSDVIGVKQKRAAKLARKQLALAEKFKNENKQDAFYNEVLTALNSYVSDKLNIPVADLSKENIAQNLTTKFVSTETVAKLINTLNDCEYARYAPSAAEKDLNFVYNNTIELITNIENDLSEKLKVSKSKIQTALLLGTLLLGTQVFSINIQDSASIAYSKQEYKKAINYYEIILASGNTSYALHYNLGNAYFKDNQMGKAIYNYELARKINPTDEDVNNNLRIANTKTIDKIDAKENYFVNSIKSGLYSLFSTTGWAYISIISLVVAALFFVLFIVVQNVVLKRLGFWGGNLFVICFVFSLVVGYAALHNLHKETQAIIISAEVKVLSAPNESSKSKFNLHEGTKVNVLSTNADFTAVQLANGNEGFVATKYLGMF